MKKQNLYLLGMFLFISFATNAEEKICQKAVDEILDDDNFALRLGPQSGLEIEKDTWGLKNKKLSKALEKNERHRKWNQSLNKIYMDPGLHSQLLNSRKSGDGGEGSSRSPSEETQRKLYQFLQDYLEPHREYSWDELVQKLRETEKKENLGFYGENIYVAADTQSQDLQNVDQVVLMRRSADKRDQTEPTHTKIAADIFSSGDSIMRLHVSELGATSKKHPKILVQFESKAGLCRIKSFEAENPEVIEDLASDRRELGYRLELTPEQCNRSKSISAEFSVLSINRRSSPEEIVSFKKEGAAKLEVLINKKALRDLYQNDLNRLRIHTAIRIQEAMTLYKKLCARYDKYFQEIRTVDSGESTLNSSAVR